MTIVVADDSALLREGVRSLVEKRGHTVRATASTADELLAVVDGTEDLVITDVRMPPGMRDDGLRAAVTLRERFPHLGVMVLSQYVAPAYARALFDASASAGTGYLLKDRVSQVLDFLTSCEVVAGGGVVVDPDVAAALMRSGRSGLAELTPREREVLDLMAQGLSNAQICGRLFLSAAAVSKHVSNIFAKLHLEPNEDNRRVRAILRYLTETTGQM
ncbi:response regulator transcription factor [Corynebacterium uterequi]|nr:response regulator transcription factor [Corynebacterium uterequi]